MKPSTESDQTHFFGRTFYHAFLWTRQDGIVALGAPSLPLSGVGSFGWLINDRQRVIGSHDSSLSSHRAFSWTARDGMVDLGTLGGRRVFVSALNNADEVVGSSSLAPTVENPNFLRGPEHAFWWTPTGGMIDLGTFGGPSSAPSAINEKGQVVGGAQTESLASHAFLWTSTEGMVDLGTLGGASSSATDVNEAGAVVGCSGTTGDAEGHAFLWTAAHGMVDLGTLGGSSCAVAINDRGQVVGWSHTAEGRRGFVWTASEGMVDLAPLPGYASSDAFFVNNSGQVVGISYTQFQNTNPRATMWRTTPSGAVAPSSSQ